MPNTILKKFSEDTGITPDPIAGAAEIEVLTFLVDKFPRLDSDARIRVVEWATRLHSDTSKKAKR